MEASSMGGSIIYLPGIGGSDSRHWQSLWAARDDNQPVFKPGDWDHPLLEDWLAELDRVVAAAPRPPVLVAHSLACLLVAHWAHIRKGVVVGAFMVAVPDPEGPNFPRIEAGSFASPPRRKLPFPALIIASTNDPYGSTEYARDCADIWEAGLVVAGEAGHINSDSGLGDWRFGTALLDAFVAGCARR
jgi:uncharacterized protein